MATNNIINVATAALNTILQGQGVGTAPAFSTATYPATTTANQLLFSSSTNTVGGLATAANGLLVTSNSSVPSILAGPGTTGQVLQANAAAAPSFSTASYPSTTTINQILFSSAANTVGGITAGNQSVLTSSTTGVPSWTSIATNGQLIIGSTAGNPAAATLTAGTGITITNASNSITIANTNPSGFPWTDVTTATQTLATNNGYVTDRGGGVTYTLPSTANLGDTMKLIGKAGIATVAQNANQQIIMSSADSTVGVGGSVVGTDEADCVTLICTTSGASTVWTAESFVGNWTVN